MQFLIFFAFIAGLVTILSPCVLPVLPIVLSGGLTGGKKRPLGIVAGFVASFTFFTLSLTFLVKLTGISADTLRVFSIIIIFCFGLTLLIPRFQLLFEVLMSKFSPSVSYQNKHADFFGGLMIGLSLGLIWTPCVGPILASVITLAATNGLTATSVYITLAYSFGTALPMLLITYGGRSLLQKVPWLLSHTAKVQKVFGVFMIITALGIYFNIDRRFQTYVLNTFPQYGTGLIQLEDNEKVRKQLEQLKVVNKQMDISNTYPLAPELISGGEWFNSKPLTLAQLKGRVVLIDFWTYTCINCIRTLPYLQSWHDKYASKGLVIIGVHTPEFEFEKNADNVKKAVIDFGLKYPIMQDNNYATWQAYNNQYWPAKYFVDKNGRVRSSHFGEGDYEKSERLIQELLKETGVEVSQSTIKSIPNEASFGSLTPETYLGDTRRDRFTSESNSKLPLHYFRLSGEWNIQNEYAETTKDSALEFRFQSQKVFLVITPPSDGGTIEVFLDGERLPSEFAGSDVVGGTLALDKPRLYNVIKLPVKGDHIFKLKISTPHVKLFAFTFG